MKPLSRRGFIGTAAMATGALALLADASFAAEKDMFIHHVYFWLKKPGNNKDTEKLAEGLKTLTGISTIRLHHIGRPASTNREVIDRSYDISWLLVFDNAADQEQYQSDPIHLEFVKNYSQLWSRVVVYDSVNI